MAAGQCRLDPPSGIAGEIYSGWIAVSGTMLGSGVALSGSPIRGMIAAQIESIAAVINNYAGGNHTLGTSVAWTLGSGGSGQYSFGAGCPSGSIVSIAGCDEGGTIAFNTGANTNAGDMFRISFGSPFPSAPAVTFAPADAGAANAVFGNRIYVSDKNSGSFGLFVGAALSSATLTFSWTAKGRT